MNTPEIKLDPEAKSPHDFGKMKIMAPGEGPQHAHPCAWQKGLQLFTKDGRKIGNAIIIEKLEGAFVIETDFGNTATLDEEEIRDMFWLTKGDKAYVSDPEEWRAAKNRAEEPTIESISCSELNETLKRWSLHEGIKDLLGGYYFATSCKGAIIMADLPIYIIITPAGWERDHVDNLYLHTEGWVFDWRKQIQQAIDEVKELES